MRPKRQKAVKLETYLRDMRTRHRDSVAALKRIESSAICKIESSAICKDGKQYLYRNVRAAESRSLKVLIPLLETL
ncbi:hypothetical protein KIPB_011880 [Kipferlia bialata]|uniref:Uncharacterized protein n=1 Tax=Kipferlia bialata TaxID=797122 RepID=A0A9K3D5X0_9EUKA|nr:hypothetical protein KIPB_011880 [Kipferlia bialata]|eukprot:g11880.t1